MSEAEAQKAVVEDRTFSDILSGLLGKVVTVINAESYEHAPVGYTLKAGFYKAKVVGAGTDYLAVLTEHKRGGKEAGKEPVKQFLPYGKIKRLSLMKSEVLIHI